MAIYFKKLIMTVVPVALIGVLSLPLGAFAQSATDDIVTGSVRPAEQARHSTNGTTAFRHALTLLDQGKAGEAYAAARALPDNLERRTIQWAAIRFGNHQVDFASIQRFAADAPHFESRSIFKTRFEQALTRDDASYRTVLDSLGGQMPNILDAQILLAEAYIQDGQKARAARIARAIWVGNFLTRADESKTKARLGPLLSSADHWDRAVHLLMHDRAAGAERLFQELSPAQQSLTRARIAVSRKAANAQQLIDKVDPSLRNHPLFHFNRGQFAREKGALDTAVNHLNKAKGDVPDSAEFWYERRLIVRRALAAGQYETANRAAAGYTDGPEGRVVDANFHAGWVALAFLNDPVRARGHFEKMLSLSTLPGSITQSNFWLGRSLLALGDIEGAKRRYDVAAKFGTEYYGQLAREALGRDIVAIRKMPQWRDSEAVFDQLELVRAVRLLAANRKIREAQTLVRRLTYSVSEPGHYVLAARLAQSVGAHHLAILIADTADKRNIPLDLFLYPKDGIPSNARLAEIDPSAVYAVARQESHFDVDALSRSGAMGLMQLMPATAKEVAGKLGVAYSSNRLTTDAAYNALLGSTYLAGQIRRYDGSLVLAAAAYNAGAGNVNKWLKSYGDPRDANVDPISWIELIPFVETRKYVQRVMGNYLMYNARLGKPPISMSEALRRIPS